MNKKHKIIFLLILDDIEGKQQFGNRHTKKSLKSFSIKNHLRGFKFFEIIQNHEYHTGAYGYLFEAVFVLASRLQSEGDMFNKRKNIFSPALFISSFVES